MNYYWFNREEILQKAKGIYSKEKAKEYHKKYQELVQYKKDALKNK